MTQLSRPPLASAATFFGEQDRVAATSVHALKQANADLLGVQSEDVTDRLERERPTGVRGADPSLGFAKEIPPAVVARVPMLVEAGGRIEQHCPEKPPFPQSDGKPAPQFELSRENDLRKGVESLGCLGSITVELHGVR